MKCADIGLAICKTCGRETFYSEGKDLEEHEANKKLLKELDIKAREILLTKYQIKQVEQLLTRMLNEINYMAVPIENALKKLKEIKGDK